MIALDMPMKPARSEGERYEWEEHRREKTRELRWSANKHIAAEGAKSAIELRIMEPGEGNAPGEMVSERAHSGGRQRRRMAGGGGAHAPKKYAIFIECSSGT